jgi:allantoin racemase
MKIKIINPNTSTEMTESIDKAAHGCARPDTEIVTVCPKKGPISIENFHDQYVSVIGMIEEIHKGVKEKFDAFIIAAACEPGLEAAREISPVPVIGIAEASMYLASMVAHKFSIVTVLPRIKALIEEAVNRAGMSVKCASIRTTRLTVLDCENDPALVMQELTRQSKNALDEDGAEAICLGCSGMTNFANQLEMSIGAPVFDGVVSAVKIAETMVDLKKYTSKVLTYNYPEKKKYKGFQELTSVWHQS